MSIKPHSRTYAWNITLRVEDTDPHQPDGPVPIDFIIAAINHGIDHMSSRLAIEITDVHTIDEIVLG